MNEQGLNLKQTILIVKIGAIGDVIQTAAAVSFYKKQFPKNEIDWVVGTQASDIVEAMPFIRTVFKIDEKKLFSQSKMQQILELVKIIKKFALKKYDLVVIAHLDWRYQLFTSCVFAKQKRSFKRLSRIQNIIQHRNRVFEYWRLLTLDDTNSSHLDIANEMQSLGSYLETQSHYIQNSLPMLMKNQYIVLMPGGAKNLLRSDDMRRWPLENYKQLAFALKSKNIDIVLVGGPSDKWVLEAFATLDIIDLIGKTTLLDLFDILNKASVIISHDTGVLHLACTTDKPIIALFGPTPSNAIVPKSRQYLSILSQDNKIACAPCYDGKNYADCQRPDCMMSITVESVVEEVMKFLHLSEKGIKN